MDEAANQDAVDTCLQYAQVAMEKGHGYRLVPSLDLYNIRVSVRAVVGWLPAAFVRSSVLGFCSMPVERLWMCEK